MTPEDAIFDFATPATPDSDDGSSVSLGTEFKSDQAGWVTGVRFYKSAANTGTHVGSLWTTGGTLLASATFTDETASRWHNVTFSDPTVGTTYVASYFARDGHYSLSSRD